MKRNPLKPIHGLIGMALCLCTALSAQEAFREVAEAARLGVTFSQGVSVVDYNADGLDDLFITRRNRNNQLFQNQGDGTFMDVAETAGLDHVGRSNQSIWADYDADGDLDCYLTIDDEPNHLYQNQGDGTFINVAQTAGVALPDFGTAALWGDVNGDQLLDLFVIQLKEDDRFYLNNGDGTFRDVTATIGIAQQRLSMGAILFDFDKDDDLDLYLSHDAHEGNFLYENDGQGNFTDISDATGIYSESEAMGVSVGDFNNDGWADLYLTNRLENFLFRNNGGTSFTEIGAEAAVDDQGMGWGVSWLDFDNDGLLDLYIANDSHYSDHPNVLYRNNGDETFTVIDSETAIASDKGSYATALADLDQNGFPDLMVANRGNIDRAQVFMNEMTDPNAWLVIRLKREQVGLSSIGATIEVETNLATHQRYVISGTSWSADDSKALHFGLGEATTISKVTVSWPDGSSTEYADLETNKAYALSDAGEVEALSYDKVPLQLDDEEDEPVDDVVTSLLPDEENQPLKLYPNPTSGLFQLSLNQHSTGLVRIELIAPSGQISHQLYKQRLPAGEHQLSLKLPTGAPQLLLLKIQSGSEVYFRKVFRQGH